MPPVTPRTIRLPVEHRREAGPAARPELGVLGGLTSSAGDLGRASTPRSCRRRSPRRRSTAACGPTEVTCGGTTLPRPSTELAEVGVDLAGPLRTQRDQAELRVGPVEEALDRGVHHRVVLPGHRGPIRCGGGRRGATSRRTSASGNPQAGADDERRPHGPCIEAPQRPGPPVGRPGRRDGPGAGRDGVQAAMDRDDARQTGATDDTTGGGRRDRRGSADTTTTDGGSADATRLRDALGRPRRPRDQRQRPARSGFDSDGPGRLPRPDRPRPARPPGMFPAAGAGHPRAEAGVTSSPSPRPRSAAASTA